MRKIASVIVVILALSPLAIVFQNCGQGFDAQNRIDVNSSGQPIELACNFNGQSIASGTGVTAYQAGMVASGSTCISETRTCTNGVLSGTYTFGNCNVGAPASCTFNGQVLASGGTTAGFTAPTVPFGSLCSSVSATVTCTNGMISPNPAYPTCTVQAGPDPLPIVTKAATDGLLNCVNLASGSLKCWGFTSFPVFTNTTGAMGTPNAPLTVLNQVSDVSMTYGSWECHIINGALTCTGGGFSQSNPTLVTKTLVTSGATKVSVGFNIACAIVNSRVQCWHLYDNRPNPGRADVTLYGPVTPREISTSPLVGCAIVENGQLQCWSIVLSNEIQTYYIRSISGVMPIIESGVTKVANHNNGQICALVNRDLQCWSMTTAPEYGPNFYSKPDGSRGQASYLNRELVSTDVVDFSMSTFGIQTCVVKSNGSAACWADGLPSYTIVNSGARWIVSGGSSAIIGMNDGRVLFAPGIGAGFALQTINLSN